MLRSSATETWKPSTKQLRAAASNSAQLDTSAWDSVSAVTLTLKQALWSEGRRIFADEHQCSRAFRHFMNLLNRAIYGSAFRRGKKRLRVIPVLEKDQNGRFHYHAAIELLPRIKPWRFQALVWHCWSRTDWGYDPTSVELSADQAWVEYMLKPTQKSGFEAWTDCIDWNNLHNPIANA
jgi:hypothetical protein